MLAAGGGLDSNHDDTSLLTKTSGLFNNVFNETLNAFINFPKSKLPNIEIRDPLETFAVNNDLLTDPKSAANRMFEDANAGEVLGRKTVYMTKVAFANAADASNMQYMMAGIKPTFKEGVFNDLGQEQTTNVNAEVFLRRLSRFIEPDHIKRTLWDFAASNDNGKFSTAALDNAQINKQQPDQRLSALAAMEADPSRAAEILRTGVAGKIKQQKLSAHYSRQPGVPSMSAIASRVANQFKSNINYMVRPANRFMM